jgi:GT2 family glycosyltransferase
VWESAGPLREDFRFYAQDLDFCVRARRLGWGVRLLPQVRVEHRHGATIAKGSALPYKPELLWPDLLTWGRGEYGDAWARRARRAMIVAAWWRSLWRRDFRRGYEALRNSPS